MSTGYPLIDSALEAGNYKLALKLVDKRILQQPSSSHNHACRCFILANAALSPDDITTAKDALEESLTLAGKTPSDPNSLDLLDSTFQLLDYIPKEDVYEAAMRKYQSSNLAYEWFKKTIDKNDLMGMQKASMALSKVFKADTENGKMIKFWAAATMTVVIDCCKDKERLANGKDKLLAMLGLKIIETVEHSYKKGLNAQQMYVKCKLLLKKGCSKECLEELKNFLDKESDLELRLMYFDELEKTEMWEGLYNSCIDYLVRIGVDDWDTWKFAILSAKKLNNTEKLNKIISDYKIGRNSQLAKIKILEGSNGEGIKEAVHNYLNLYMHKLCCFLDLEYFLKKNIIPAETILQILEEKFKEADLEAVISGERKGNEKDLTILVNYTKIKACVKPILFEDKEFFSTCCKYFEVTKHLQKNLAEYDYFAGFEFLILAIESYFIICENEINSQSYFNLIVLFEYALLKNKYEFHLQLWLAHLYSNTNLSIPLTRIYHNLKIKNLQIDTLAPHFTNHITSKTRNSELISTALKFYTQNVAAELPPMVMSCFEHSTFSKLKGFLEFKIRVENSTTHIDTILKVIQNNRLREGDKSIGKISVEYIPLLKKAYQTLILNGSDVDLKLHDNSDRKILWSCGDHNVHSIPQKFLESKFSRLVDVKYVKIQLLHELLVYDQHSRVWDDYKARFLSLLKDAGNLESFTKMEKVILSGMEWLLTQDTPLEVSIEGKPKDSLSAEFNNHYLLLQDYEKILSAITKQSSPLSFFGKESKHAQVTKAQSYLRKLCRNIDRDEIIAMTKKDISAAKEASQTWFATDAFGKQFNVSEDFINQCYKTIEQDALKAAREI